MHSPGTGLKQVTNETTSSSTSSIVRSAQLTHSDNDIVSDGRSCDMILNAVTSPMNKDNDGWQKVERRRKQLKYRYTGKSGVARDVDVNFRAAEKKVPVFITNVHSETKKEDIIKYIHSKTHESVSLQRIITKKQTDHSAFKFFVSQAKLSMYLDENLWPEGIIFRRFVNFIPRSMNRVVSDSGLTNNKNE